MNASLWKMTLDEVCTETAKPQPAPAGVAVAAASAAFGLSLLIKVLAIAEKRPDLQEPARELVAQLQSGAEDDAAAVHRYLHARDSSDTRELVEAPLRVLEAAVRGAALCAEARPEIKGLIAADVQAALEMLAGAARAVDVCLEHNLKSMPHPDGEERRSRWAEQLRLVTTL